ncbi:hypothetical protein VDR45_16575 [Xanthomonas campestris pv. campestris]|nr:hypothetical protein [Xanthomonas campestris pv. campestris]
MTVGIGEKIFSRFGSSEISGSQLSYYQDRLSGLYASISSHEIAGQYLSAHNVSFLGDGLVEQRKVGVFNLNPVDFCRLFMVFNNAGAYEHTKTWSKRYGQRKSLEAPLGVYVISFVRGLTTKDVRVGIFKASPFDFFGESLYMDHLKFDENFSRQLIGTIAISLSLLTAFRVGIKSVRLFAAGGYDRFRHTQPKSGYCGYRVCPKFGFDAPLFREKMRDPRFKGCKKVSDVVRQDPGLWDEFGFERMMEFDMRPDSHSWNTLIAYLHSKNL